MTSTERKSVIDIPNPSNVNVFGGNNIVKSVGRAYHNPITVSMKKDVAERTVYEKHIQKAAKPFITSIANRESLFEKSEHIKKEDSKESQKSLVEPNIAKNSHDNS